MVTGVGYAGVLFGIFALADVVPQPSGGALCVLFLFLAPACTPWVVSRNE